MDTQTLLTEIKHLLPTKKLMATLYPSVILPKTYLGTNDNVKSGEMLSDLISQYGSWDNVLTNLTIDDLPVGFSDYKAATYHWGKVFYAPKSNSINYYTFCTSLFNTLNPSYDQLVDALYLAHFYEDNCISLLTVLNVLYKSKYVGLASPNVPSRTQIDNFNSTSVWLREEGLPCGLEVTWIFSRKWDKQKFVEIISNKNIEMSRIGELIFLGYEDIDSIHDYVTGEAGIFPESWLKDLLDKAGYFEDNEKVK